MGRLVVWWYTIKKITYLPIKYLYSSNIYKATHIYKYHHNDYLELNFFYSYSRDLQLKNLSYKMSILCEIKEIVIGITIEYELTETNNKTAG